MAESNCAVPSCERDTVARGWCYLHWGRWRRTGDVQADKPIRQRQPNKPPQSTCGTAGCERPHYARDLCQSHYARWVTGKDTTSPLLVRYSTEGQCRSDGCDRPTHTRGYCTTHYARVYRHGTDAPPVVPSAEELAARAERRRQYVLEWKRRYYADNLDQMRDRTNAWRRNNAERAKLHDQRKRYTRREVRRVPFTVDALAQKIAYWGHRCWICSGPYDAMDHVKPLSKGGWHMLANLRPICTPCNSRKHNRWPYPIAMR